MQGNNLLQPLSEKGESLEKEAIYEHYKGFRYKIIGVARHSETLEELVVYQALYGEGGIWLRPLVMFLEYLELDGKKVPRFKQVPAS